MGACALLRPILSSSTPFIVFVSPYYLYKHHHPPVHKSHFSSSRQFHKYVLSSSPLNLRTAILTNQNQLIPSTSNTYSNLSFQSPPPPLISSHSLCQYPTHIRRRTSREITHIQAMRTGTKGFQVKKRVTHIFRFLFRRFRSRTWKIRLDRSPAKRFNAVKNCIRWGSNLGKKARNCLFGSGYRRVGRDGKVCDERVHMVPKGHLNVYVGENEDGGCYRVMVPVIYFNHPLFGELLREAEEKFGFDHPGGGITIPCPLSEFENVTTRIKAGGVNGRRRSFKKINRMRC